MPDVRKYISKQRLAARRGERQQTVFGRVRHYVISGDNMYHIENEYINTPIQSIASDLTLFSLMEIYDWLVSEGYYIPYDYENSRVRIIITVHDSIVLECEDDDDLIREVAQHCQGVMRDVPAKVLPDCRVPFKADIEVGYKWGKLGEL